MSRLAHATSDNSLRRSKSQTRLVALTQREPALRTALAAAKARLAAQQRTSMLRLVADSHCRKSNESRQRRAREEELVWEGEQLVARKSANLAVKVVSLIRKQKFQVCKSLSRCKAVVNAASIEFHDEDNNKEEEKKNGDDEKKEAEQTSDKELYESLHALLCESRATVIRLTDERDRLEGVSMKAAQSALRDARSTVEQLRKEEEAREIEEELLQAELTALVVLDRKATKKRAAIAELLSRHRASVMRLESALERGQKQQAERLRRFKRRASSRSSRISQSSPRLDKMKERFVKLRRRRILAEEQLEAQRSTGLLQSLIFGNGVVESSQCDVRMRAHKKSFALLQNETKSLEMAMKQRTSDWQELQQHREENLVLLRAILSSYELDRESMEVDMRGVAITGVLSSSDSRLRDDAKQLHSRICVLHQGLVSLQIAASKWQSTYDEEEKDAIAELTTLQSEADQREIEREEIELEGLALRGERELARKKKQIQRDKIQELSNTMRRLESELETRTLEIRTRREEHEKREIRREKRERLSHELDCEMTTRRPLVSHLLWRAKSREESQRQYAKDHLVVYPCEQFSKTLISVREEASSSFEKEMRREKEAREDVETAQKCDKLNSKHSKKSFEAMLELQKALHNMSKIRVDRVSSSSSNSFDDKNDVNIIVKDLRVSGEALMPSLETEYDEIAMFSGTIQDEIEVAKYELSCMDTRRSSRATECRDIDAARDAVISNAQCTKQKREHIVKIVSDSTLHLKDSKQSQDKREKILNQYVEWLESVVVVAEALQEKSKLRFDYVQKLRKEVQKIEHMVNNSWTKIRDEVSILTPLSRNIDSDFEQMLNKRSEVEDWISQASDEISSDMVDSREVLSRLRKIRIETSGCDLSDRDLTLVNRNHENQLCAELVLERHKTCLNRLRNFREKLDRANAMINAVRVSNAKEMSSLRVISSKLIVMESGS